MKNQKGVVLVALVVIVVVMIILFKVTIKETEDNKIIENADKANFATEKQYIIELFTEARSFDENNKANILQTAQNFIKNNRESNGYDYKVIPDPFERSDLYQNSAEKIIIVKGQTENYKFKLTEDTIEYLGTADSGEIEILNY